MTRDQHQFYLFRMYSNIFFHDTIDTMSQRRTGVWERLLGALAAKVSLESVCHDIPIKDVACEGSESSRNSILDYQ